MDRYTYETLRWLELHFDPEQRAALRQAYVPYQPIDGISENAWTPQTFLMASRWARLLYHLRHMNAGSFLDIGGAEGFIADLVRRRLGIPSVSLDLSTKAGQRAREFLGVPALGGESHQLPFHDGAFDVIYMGEVIEHLAHPVRSLLEAQRVAKRAVIITSEAFVRSEEDRAREIAERDEGAFEPHMDRTFLHPDDFRVAFAGWHLLITNQCASLPNPMPQNARDLQRAFEPRLTKHDLEEPAHAIFVLADRAEPNEAPGPEIANDIEFCLERVRPRTQPRHRFPVDAPVPSELTERMCCPVTHEPLKRAENSLVAHPSGRRYDARFGVPSMVTPLGEGFAQPLEALLAARAADPKAADSLLELDRRLSYEMPPSVKSDVLLANGPAGWRPGPGVQIEARDGGGVTIETNHQDPCLFSPRLDRRLSELRGVTVELCAWADADYEELQVFFWTLNRPLWCEAASNSMHFQTGGALHRMFLDLPRHLYPDDDELLAIRVDPTHGPSRVAIVQIVLEST